MFSNITLAWENIIWIKCDLDQGTVIHENKNSFFAQYF